jgi:DNA-binding NarL/FixJ family response regulator
MWHGSDDHSRILLVSVEDHDAIHHLCARLKLDLHYSPSLAAALSELHHARSDVVLYDQDLPSGDWRQAVAALRKASPRSSIILLAHLRQPDLWNEVIRRGGHDLLTKPVAEPDAESTIVLAIARAKLSRAS